MGFGKVEHTALQGQLSGKRLHSQSVSGTDYGAGSASRAVSRIDLYPVSQAIEMSGIAFGRRELCRRTLHLLGSGYDRSDGGMRAYERAECALYAFRRIPLRHVDGYAAFFVCGRAHRYYTVGPEKRYGQRVAFEPHAWPGNPADKVG